MWSVGVDLGQAQDHSAIAAIEWVGGERRLRHIERLPLGLSYNAVAARIRQLVTALPGCRLIVDATGVGRPVVDALRASGLDPVPVCITSGRCIRRDGAGFWRVPKAALIQPLVAALEGGSLNIAQGLPAGPTLMQELGVFKRRIGVRGHIGLAAAGRTHDDLVLSVALALWQPPGAEGCAAQAG